MSYSVRFTAQVREDLLRRVVFLAERDPAAAAHARTAIGDAVSLLERFPPSCRMPDASHPRIREGLYHGTYVSHHVTRVNVRASGARSGCAE